MKKRLLSIYLAIAMIIGIFPGTLPALADDISYETYISVLIDNELAKDKDGFLMAQRKVIVTDTDNDGIISYKDAMVCLHRGFFSQGESGFSSSNGSANKLWGIDKEGGKIYMAKQKLFVENMDDEMSYSSIDKSFVAILNKADNHLSSFQDLWVEIKML